MEVEYDSQCGLRELRLGLVVLMPSLADQFADFKAPRLEKLCLLVKEVPSASSPSPLSYPAVDCRGRPAVDVELGIVSFCRVKAALGLVPSEHIHTY